jgi:hypothetical protein
MVGRHHHAIRTFGVAVLLMGAACGCGGVTPTPTSSAAGPAVLGIDWGRAERVERPANYTATLNPSEKVPDHPILRIPGQAIMADVATHPDGSLVAVGYVPPVFTAEAWTSKDGTDWALHPIDPDEFTFAVGVAAGEGGSAVAVGRSRGDPVAWTSADGTTWEKHTVPVLDPKTAERMTTVIATPDGYLAGGSAGPELADRHARFWRSVDGRTWDAVPDDAAAFADAEVRSITRFGDASIAVGVVGTAQKATAAVAWISLDGQHWTRVDDPSFDGAVAVSVAAAPFGGLVAVGSDVARHEAIVWTSSDGRQWTRAPRTAATTRDPGFVWMTDVAAIGDVLVATGMEQPLQRATATSWVSRDGVHWEPAHDAPVQEQGEFYAITTGGPGAVVVGAFGGPDSYVPTVWLSPAR